ncbi:TIGR02391 family protein [Corynebacterium silvaticum]|nr:TIGR02391 family protein [Corynebacterium silvaticum]UWH00829.1 TIGR02391 family protein [Corynebacterium silvaticum]UWH02877.1 TIGR02391 family protein [Corynebacterium silvaticum]UWH04916.1 TIGR02391 family protein [Corynebacterium silvaticum]UXZ27076.1 TIGR02391 family protein [Corynebacterium silvaticum]
MVHKMTPFPTALITAISDVLAQTDAPGLTGSELRQALQRCGDFVLQDGNNKRESLAIALSNIQAKQGAGNIVIRFITEALNPSIYAQPGQRERWHELREQINAVLAMHKLKVNDQGKVSRLAQPPRSLDEVEALTNSLKRQLEYRNCHSTLLQYCNQELIHQSLFHAISEAAKSIPDRIRSMTGLTQDGAALFHETFGSRNQEPLIIINDYKDDSDRSEQEGFKNLLIGIHGHFRNPRAHRTRQGSQEMPDEFLDAFGTFSYVHKRLDRSHRKQ